MKAIWAIAAVGLGLIGQAGSVSAQYYGGDPGYRERGPGYGYREREYRDRGYDYEERGPRGRDRNVGFDEREYLRCNPDVRRAVNSGAMESGYAHFQRHGRREGRRLSC